MKDDESRECGDSEMLRILAFRPTERVLSRQRWSNFDEGFRADIIVEEKVILELKSVEQMSKVHHKQVFTYLKLKELKLGYLLNFGASLMKDGLSA